MFIVFAYFCLFVWWHRKMVVLSSLLFSSLMAVLLEFPFSVIQRANLTCLQPTWNAMEMECMLKFEEEKIKMRLAKMKCDVSSLFDKNLHCIHPKQRYILRLLLMPDLLDIRCTNPWCDFGKWRNYQPQYLNEKKNILLLTIQCKKKLQSYSLCQFHWSEQLFCWNWGYVRLQNSLKQRWRTEIETKPLFINS